jgi:hypothetical protein
LRAESTAEPAVKGQLYGSAEQCLELATKLCLKSGHKERLTQIEDDLDRLRRRSKLASTMAQVFAIPPPTSSAIAMRPPGSEQPKGLDKFDDANILARLTCEREVEVGGTMQLQIDLFNTGKVPAAAQKVEGLIPRGFKFLRMLPDAFTMEGSSLLLHGKSLEPLKIESLQVTLQAEEEGDATFSPKLIYLDGRGGRHGPALYELVARGLVETRTFSGQRGRGGEVVRVRVAYGREPVKRHVDKAIMKTTES